MSKEQPPLRPLPLDGPGPEALKGVDPMLEVDIPDDQIDICMAQASGRYLWYAVLASRSKLHREVVEAQIALEKRGEWSDTKTTEQMITELVRYDERWQRARSAELLFGDLAKAFEKRMDLVQSVGSWLRSERGKQITTLKQGVAKALKNKKGATHGR